MSGVGVDVCARHYIHTKHDNAESGERRERARGESMAMGERERERLFERATPEKGIHVNCM